MNELNMIASLEKNFRGYRLPSTLKKLAQVWDEGEMWFGGDFELYGDGIAATEIWWKGNTRAAERFLIFGRDRTHSLYGYWLHDGIEELFEAPIVFLGSDGDTAQIANSIEDFCALLAHGFTLVGAHEDWDEEAAKPDPTFNAWLEKEIGLRPAKAPSCVIRAANDEHPDFFTWAKKQGRT